MEKLSNFPRFYYGTATLKREGGQSGHAPGLLLFYESDKDLMPVLA